MRKGWSTEGDRRVLFGETPWGYRLSEDRTKLVADKEEQRVIAVVRHMRAKGLTLHQIVRLLAALGVVNRRGRPFGLSRVFEMTHGGRKAKRDRAKRRANG